MYTAFILPILAIVVVCSFLVAGLLLWLWNTTMPDVSDLKRITYWQAYRLMLLAALLFGGTRFAIGK